MPGVHQISHAEVLGITMVGSALTFYKVPISEELIHAIITGQCPAQKTIVKKLVPPVLRHAAYLSEGMKPLDNRYIILQCLKAFKSFVSFCDYFIA